MYQANQIIRPFVIASLVTVIQLGVACGQEHKPKMETPITGWTNYYRQAYGRSALQVNEKLVKIAREHAKHMAKLERMEHVLDGKNVMDRAKEAGYQYHVVTENLAFNIHYENPAWAFFQGWMYSPPHWRNIQGRDFTETGVGVYQSKSGKYYACQVFGSPGSNTAGILTLNNPATPAQPPVYYQPAAPRSQSADPTGIYFGFGNVPGLQFPQREYYIHPFNTYSGW